MAFQQTAVRPHRFSTISCMLQAGHCNFYNRYDFQHRAGMDDRRTSCGVPCIVPFVETHRYMRDE